MYSYSKNGMNLTESFESCRLVAYLDLKGVPTIAWGHTRGVLLGDTCTQEQADAWLLEDLQVAVDDVNRLVKVSLTQEEFDALVDFVYNVGGGNFASSTLLRDLNMGCFTDVAAQFDLWDHASGKVVAGLLRRRQAETDLFEES